MRNLWLKLLLIAYLLFLLLHTVLNDCPIAVGLSIIMSAIVSFIDLTIAYMFSIIMSELLGRILFMLFLAHGLYYLILGTYIYMHRTEDFNDGFITFKSVMLVIIVVPTSMLAFYIYKDKD